MASGWPSSGRTAGTSRSTRSCTRGRDAPDVEEHRYPFAGGRNATLRLGIVAAGGGPVTWMDLGTDDDQYLVKVTWRPDGVLAAQLMARDQRSARWLLFAADGTATVFAEDRGVPWLNAAEDETRFLRSGEVLRATEASGFRHLDLVGADGVATRRLTDGDWMVTRVVGVDESRRVAWFVGTRVGPRERHVYTVGLDGGPVERWSEGHGVHDAVLSRDGAHVVETWSSVEHPPRVTLRRSDRTEVAVLHEDRSVRPETLGLAVPRFVELPASDGTTLHGALYEAPREDGGGETGRRGR